MFKILNTLVYLVTEKPIGGVGLDTWINLLGTIIIALLSWIISYQTAKGQIDKQSKNDIKRERTLISEKLKLDTYLELNELLREYEDKVDSTYKSYTVYESGMIQRDWEQNEKFKADFTVLTDLNNNPTIIKIEGRIGLLPEIKSEYDSIHENYKILIYMISHRLSIGEIDTELDEKSDVFYHDGKDGLEDCYKKYKELVGILLDKIQGKINEIIK